MPQIQSVLFDNTIFDTFSSKKWLREHYIKPMKKVHKTDNFLRYRIETPPKNKRYMTIDYEKGVKIVLVY